MTLQNWDERYRSTKSPQEHSPPAELVIGTAAGLAPGRLLDLACGTGRHALWFAERRWNVTAVDGSSAAIDILRRHATARNLNIHARVADLEKHEFAIEPSAWDLIVIWLYLQRDLFDAAKLGVKPGGVIIASVLIADAGDESQGHRLCPGELRGIFEDWEILSYSEHSSNTPGSDHAAAEITARRPPATFLRIP